MKKVLIYITRKRSKQIELLVFEHRDFPDAGIQVPAGTVKENEEIKEAAIRETKEESGISIVSPKLVGTYEWYRADIDELQERSVFHFHMSRSTEDAWHHKVTGTDEEEDRGLIFNFYWIPIHKGGATLSGQQGNYLADLDLSALN